MKLNCTYILMSANEYNWVSYLYRMFEQTVWYKMFKKIERNYDHPSVHDEENVKKNMYKIWNLKKKEERLG